MLKLLPDRMKYLSVFALMFVLLASCQSPKQKDAEGVVNEPKAVSLKWQSLLNNNQFAEAKKWSTPNAVEWLEWLEATISSADSLMTLPLFIQGTCREVGEKATCVFLMEDAGELYQDSIFLLKIKGQWLVDIPAEDLIEDPAFEQLIEGIEAMEKLIEEAAPEK